MEERDWNLTVQRARALAEEAGSLLKAGQAPGPRWLGSAAPWLSQTAPTWEAMTGEVPAERAYRLLVSSLHFEAWLICWPPGSRLELHDHGGASGAFQVVDGTLHEASVQAKVSRLRVRDLAAGESIGFGPDYVHDVVNRGAGPATSVHLYGAANRSMAFYRLHPSSRGPEPLGRVEPAVSVDAVMENCDKLGA
jgi:quercetin dioxygenase-like cupin family protein